MVAEARCSCYNDYLLDNLLFKLSGGYQSSEKGCSSMEITYVFNGSLYVNITNQCTNACEFCIRHNTDSVGSSKSLWLETEPEKEQILADILARKPQQYQELVFCGFGEPTCRLADLLWVCRKLKEAFPDLPVRVNTNGHASLIAGRDAAPLFEGLVDSISISLNAKNAADYLAICHPQHGEKAFDAMLDFAVRVKQYVKKVTLSIVDSMPAEDIAACKQLADSLGIPLRIRHYIA